jgi:hypothetical protein
MSLSGHSLTVALPLALLGCAAAQAHPVASDGHAEPSPGVLSVRGDLGGAAENAQVTEADLSDDDREAYLYNKLAVVDAASESTYTIRDGRNALVTENEFIRRYRVVLGRELDPYEKNHAVGQRIGWGIVTGVGLGLMVGGLALTFTAPSQCNNGGVPQATSAGSSNSCGLSSQGLAGAVLGGAGFATALTGGIGFGLAFGRGPYDGPPAEHRLAVHEAERYIERYNRALLVKIKREEQASPPSAANVRVAPVLSPGFTGIGIVGQF